MPVNSDKPHLWKRDIAQSVDFYNDWFLRFAPKAYRDTRINTTKQVETMLRLTANLTMVVPEVLLKNPALLAMLRMTTAPPIARDRLIGLAKVSPHLVKSMEVEKCIPPKMEKASLELQLKQICEVINKLSDKDIFPWLDNMQKPSRKEIYRAATVVADRLCGAVTDPIIRNAQERRQLNAIKEWLEKRGYFLVKMRNGIRFHELKPGTFAFRVNVLGQLEDGSREVNIPIDVVITPKNSKQNEFPLLIEAKSAGDFTNTNKRRKEEAVKIAQLRNKYGDKVQFILFLCGYFDSGYLGYEAAEGIDWVWEHRIDDLEKFGV